MSKVEVILKIILGGPARSGKSCLRQGLKDAIRRIQGAPYPFFITACPDGEGAWFQETVNQDPDLAARLKAAYKAAFTPEFVARVAESVRNCTLPLTFIDLGGIVSPENEVICAGANSAILIAGDLGRLQEWREFCAKLGIRILAEIHSDYHGTEDVIQGLGPDGVFRGRVHHLERGVDASTRPCVIALAHYLVSLANAGHRVA